MDKIKKVWKELSVFGVVLVCIFGLYIYRLMVTVDITTISNEQVVEKIENGDDFVVYAGYSTSQTTKTYQETVETYLKKNRSTTIYFVDLEGLENADEFVKTTFNETGADKNNPHTYIFIDGKLTSTKNSALGYYALDKVMTEFNEAAK